MPLLDGLDAFPKRIVDDPQRGHFLDDPFVLGIESGDALTGLGVFDEMLPVIGDMADIEFVVEDAVPALSAAVDR